MKNFDTLLLVVVVFMVLFSERIARHFRKHNKPSHLSSSLLLTFHTVGNNAFPIADGRLSDGSSYVSFVTKSADIKGNEDKIAYIVFLSFTSRIRLLAISKKSDSQLNPSFGKSLMEKVDLEGDFYKHFTLFANKGQQIESRYFLDPKAMAHLIDFCDKYDWELINNELIIITSSRIDNNLVASFIKEIRPAVEASASEVDPKAKPEYKTPFGFKKLIKKAPRGIFRCPVCNSKTIDDGKMYSCQFGHGHLMTGGELASLPKNNNLVSPNSVKVKLICPNCESKMLKVNYGNGKVVIDACAKCPYRWVDKGELLVGTK